MRLFIFTRFGVLLWELAVTSASGERPQRGQMRDVRYAPPLVLRRTATHVAGNPAAEVSLITGICRPCCLARHLHQDCPNEDNVHPQPLRLGQPSPLAKLMISCLVVANGQLTTECVNNSCRIEGCQTGCQFGCQIGFTSSFLHLNHLQC